MPVSSQNITHFVTNNRNNLRNATYKVNKNDGSTLDKKLIIKKIYENKRSIIATIIKNIDNCNLYSKNLSFFKTKNIFSKYAIVFSIISNFLLFGIYYIFIVCVYKIMIRRVFLEGRIYKKVPFKDLFFLVGVSYFPMSLIVAFVSEKIEKKREKKNLENLKSSNKEQIEKIIKNKVDDYTFSKSNEKNYNNMVETNDISLTRGEQIAQLKSMKSELLSGDEAEFETEKVKGLTK